MKTTFRLALALAVAGALVAGAASAQEFPNRPVRIIVPQAPGSPYDIQARTIAPEMQKILGQPVIVENKAGANAVLGFEYVAKQVPADGYTILIANMPNQALMPLTVKDLRFDPVKDLPPLVGMAEQRLFIGSPVSAPWKSLNEMIAWARANPGKLNYGSPSLLTGLVMRGLVQDLKLDATFIPYPTTAAFGLDFRAGTVHFGVLVPVEVISLGDQARVLGVSGSVRDPLRPDVPTLVELGYGKYVTSSAFSLNLPVGVPKAVSDKLYAAASQALRAEEVKAGISKIGMEVTADPPDVVARKLNEQAETLSAIVKVVGVPN